MYFNCVLLANLVMLRYTHNYTGINELLIFLQVTSFIWILYIDSVFFTTGVIAYFFDEFMSSATAWLGCLLLASTVFLEREVMIMINILYEQYREKMLKANSQVGIMS